MICQGRFGRVRITLLRINERSPKRCEYLQLEAAASGIVTQTCILLHFQQCGMHAACFYSI